MLRGQLGKYKLWRDSLGSSSGPAAPNLELPHDWVWSDFLKYQNWQDRTVLNRQETWVVYQRWEYYKLRTEFGLLG